MQCEQKSCGAVKARLHKLRRIYAHLIWRVARSRGVPRRPRLSRHAFLLWALCCRNVLKVFVDSSISAPRRLIYSWTALVFTQEVPFFGCCDAEICNEAHWETMCYLFIIGYVWGILCLRGTITMTIVWNCEFSFLNKNFIIMSYFIFKHCWNTS